MKSKGLALLVCFLLLASFGSMRGAVGKDAGRLRVIIETDAGGDPDDEQSLVRFLLYANEWDVEGIIANRKQARAGENRNRERSGLGIVQSLVRAYGDCYPNLVQHDARYPKPEQLLRRTVAGYDEVEEGVALVMRTIDAEDPRPVWFLNWGTIDGAASSCLKRALERVLRERGEESYKQFKSRLRLSSDNQFEPHTSQMAPPFPLWIDTFRPPINGKRWYHRFSTITAGAGGFDLVRDVLTGHGPLGTLYPTNTTHWQKEGDSMTFLYLVPTGMNDPEQPTWGSWAGRYGRNKNFPSGAYYWANQIDGWRGTTNRDNTLARWAADLQNDFRARLDWCVQPFAQANHPPRAVLNGSVGKQIVRLNTTAGAAVSLSAEGSSDPDWNALEYEWFIYPEAGNYGRDVAIQASGNKARFGIPVDAAGKDIHCILRVSDRGTPPLCAYRRLVVQVAKTGKKTND